MTDQQVFYAEVGRRIRQTREERGLTQEALAELVSLTRTSITNIEKGRQKILAHTLVALATALRVAPAALFPESNTTANSELDELLKERSRAEQDWIKAAIGSLEEEK